MTVKNIPLSTEKSWKLPALTATAAVVWVGLWTQLQPFADWLTYSVLRITPESKLGESVNFFLYDVPKIILLLGGMIFLVTFIRSFFSTEQTRALLGGKREGVGNVLAAALGVVTPFCSCSAVPLFIGFVESGIPLGVTFSFLVSAPMVNEVALVMLFGMFGWKIAGLYMGTGLLVAIIGGMVIGRLKLERYVEDFVWQMQVGTAAQGFEFKPTLDDRLRDAARATREIVGKVWIYVIIGIAVGAGIHGYVPQNFMANIMGQDAWWSVPAAVLFGIPLYSGAAGIIPVIYTLMEKGAAMGTVLAFMMSVVALSLPEMLILRKVLKPQLIAAFIAIVGTAIIFTGFMFNIIL